MENNLDDCKTGNIGDGTSVPDTENPTNPNEEKQGTTKQEVIRFNLLHLLLLHTMVKKFYETAEFDNAMHKLLNDILLMFEIYIDNTQDNDVNNALKIKYNYEPLKDENNG